MTALRRIARSPLATLRLISEFGDSEYSTGCRCNKANLYYKETVEIVKMLTVMMKRLDKEIKTFCPVSFVV